MVDQIPSNCEIILVDDGSPDNSVQVISKYYSTKLQTGQFKLIRTANAGPASARNIGLAHAAGNYIGFLDSDDVILPGYFKLVIETILGDQVDIVQFNFCRMGESGRTLRQSVIQTHRNPGYHPLDNVRNDIFGFGQWYPWARVFKRSMFNGIKFPEGEAYEDLITISQLYLNDFEICLLDDCLIGYRINESSITSNHTIDHARTLIKFFRHVSSLPRTTATRILLVQLARGLSYFRAKLNLSKEIPTWLLKKELSEARKDPDVRKQLSLAALSVLHFPTAYFFLDKLRLSYRR